MSARNGRPQVGQVPTRAPPGSSWLHAEQRSFQVVTDEGLLEEWLGQEWR
jgi:hypothetical protein